MREAQEQGLDMEVIYMTLMRLWQMLRSMKVCRLGKCR